MVSAARVIAVTRAGSAPVRRLMEGAQKAGLLVDATNGRRTRAVIVTDSNHVVLSHLTPQRIGERLSGAPTIRGEDDGPADPEEDERSEG